MSAKRSQSREQASRRAWTLGGWLLAAFLICWAFGLGVLVGQGSLATPQQISWLKRTFGLGETAPPPQTQILKDPRLNFPQSVATERQMPLPGAKPGSQPAPAPEPKAATPPAPAAEARPAKGQAPPGEARPPARPAQTAAAPEPASRPAPGGEIRPAAGPPPAAETKPTPAPRPAAPAAKSPQPAPPAAKALAPAGRRFTVQVASYQDRDQALHLVRRLQDSGLPAYMQPSDVQGVGRRYRVRVGSYHEMDAAQGVASRLRLQQKLPAYVTRQD